MDIETIRRTHEQRLLKLANVVGVALGERNGRRVIQVLVTKKLPRRELGDQAVPSELDGCPIDVVEVGIVTAD